MIDINLIRENPTLVKENMKKKFQEAKVGLVDEAYKLDKDYREVLTRASEIRSLRNKYSKEIGALMREGKRDEAEEIKAKVTSMAEELKDKISVPVVPLLQCTDTEIFCPEGETKKQYNGQYIFIGSTRGVMRDCVYWAAEAGVPLHVWGSGWYEMMPEHKDVVDSTFMPNEKLPALYRSAKVTLNDHWKDMLDNQIINNRIFDALACGLPVISDGCEEMKEIFPDAVLYYDTKEEFDACVKKVENDYEAVKAKALEQYDMIKKEYSFERRVEELLEIAEKYRK